MPLNIGTAVARPRERTTGWFDAVDLPTGGTDRFPVIIAQGDPNGPVLWLTTGIHGDEHTGVVVIHRLLETLVLGELTGTLVAVTNLNPAGLRTRKRTAYYLDGDPNRHFPNPSSGSRPAVAQLESAYARLYDVVARTKPAGLIDLHNAFIGSIAFIFRDPVFYHRRRGFGRGRTRGEAFARQERVGEMVSAFGFTVINEFAADSYVEKELHRSVSGSMLNGLGIPACTVELGSWMHVDPGVADAAAAGIRNVMRWAGMLPGDPEPIEGIPVLRPGYQVRRHMGPAAPAAGIVDMLVRPGQTVRKGERIAVMRDLFGSPLGPHDGGASYANYDGFVIGWRHGVARYRGESLMALAIPDDSEMVVPYPE
ncbi:MAG: succinylglutamate desuccinylase/aspartoacylase family protein [Anaerolineae bacterium]